MKIVCIAKEQQDYSRVVSDFLHDFYKRTNYQIEVINPDTREGSHLVSTYGITIYPAFLVLTSSGKAREIFQGTPLPRISEMSIYMTGENSRSTGGVGGMYSISAQAEDLDGNTKHQAEETDIVVKNTTIGRIGKTISPNK